MVEFIKHAFGICGEPHPSILWFLASGTFLIYYFKHTIKWCWKRGCDMCKSKIVTKLTHKKD